MSEGKVTDDGKATCDGEGEGEGEDECEVTILVDLYKYSKHGHCRSTRTTSAK